MPAQLVRLILVDGDPDGLRTAEIAGRTTKLIACPISSLERLLERSEAKRTAVYFLFGQEFERPSDAIYVGECDAVARRFNGTHHAMTKADWKQLVVAFSADAVFNKAHARRAEHLLADRVRSAARAVLMTDRTGPGDLDEGDTAFAEQFVADVGMLAETLGFTALRIAGGSSKPPPNLNTQPKAVGASVDQQLFRFVGETKYVATMRVDGDDFVVLANSFARSDETAGCAESIRTLRARARELGVLEPDHASGFLVVTRDFPVSSTSAAGGLIAGRNSRGPNEWLHVASGKTYAQWIADKQRQPEGTT